MWRHAVGWTAPRQIQPKSFQPSWVYSTLKIVLRRRRAGITVAVLFKLICKWWNSVYIPRWLHFALTRRRRALWWLTDRRATVRGAVPGIDWKSEMLAGAVWSKQTAEQEVAAIEKEGEIRRKRDKQRKGGSAVSQTVRTHRPQGDNSFHEMVFWRG